MPLASFGNHPLIGEQVVHDRQAGRSLIADPTDLNRRRLAGEDQQAVVSGVACKVEEDVDPVRPDLLRQPFVAHAGHIAPVGRGGLKAMSQAVFDDSVGVTDRLMLFLAEVLQDADQEIADRMPPQIGRNEAQAEADPENGSVFDRASHGTVQGCRVLAVVLGMGLGQCRRRDIRAIVKRVEQVAVRRGVVRLYCQRPAIAGDRFVQVPLVLERVAQVVLRLGKVGSSCSARR